jgi:hypothetical protein
MAHGQPKPVPDDGRVFSYDVFISFATENQELAAKLNTMLQGIGLRTYFYPDRNRLGEHLKELLKNALGKSEDLVVIVSSDAEKSGFVSWEVATFSNYVDGDRRRIYRLKVGRGPFGELLPDGVLFAEDSGALVNEIARQHIERRGRTEKQLRDAFTHYTHTRFWQPLVEQGDIHIFTCARDARKSESGRGGRTNIDKWDYATVVDLTHFLSRKYPTTKVTIEDPISKLRRGDMADPQHQTQIADLRDAVRNKDCIVVGSPDVSDFAEILLASAHGIFPYSNTLKKTSGFVLQKRAVNPAVPASSFYQSNPDGPEGVMRIRDRFVYEAKLNPEQRKGVMYGILAVVRNPFCDRTPNRRIVILAGLSGIATNAIAKFLTKDIHLDQFYRFDRDFVDPNRDIEAVVGASFQFDPEEVDDRDTRRLGDTPQDIWYGELIEIQPRPRVL